MSAQIDLISSGTRHTARQAAVAACLRSSHVGYIPVQLDNYIATNKESCAVVATATGQWLFVSTNMADLYADMLKISGTGDKSLEVYGYVNEGILPLLVFKAPVDLALPRCEEGYFRKVELKTGK